MQQNSNISNKSLIFALNDMVSFSVNIFFIVKSVAFTSKSRKTIIVIDDIFVFLVVQFEIIFCKIIKYAKYVINVF